MALVTRRNPRRRGRPAPPACWAAQDGVAVGKAPEAADDVGVQQGPFQAVGVAARRDRARRSAPGRRAPPNARTADRRTCVPACVDLRASSPRATARSATARASGSAAKVRALPRNMLRGNWSSTMRSASAPSGVASQWSSGQRRRPRRSAGTASRSRRRTPSSLLNQLSGPAARQNASTSAGGRRRSVAFVTAACLRRGCDRRARGRAARRPSRCGSLK